MDLKTKRKGDPCFCEEDRLYILCERIIETLKETAYLTKTDTLVSISESVHNKFWAESLEELANQIEKELYE